ncbi:MAG: sugar phosphate isomerase/epimerase [Acuticoccus sp.]
MASIKGPGLFLAQFAGDAAPFNSLPSIAAWAAECGYVAIQMPSWDGRLFDLEKAATSKDYCDEVSGICGEAGVAITDLSTHLQGQLVAVHPAYDTAFDAFAPAEVHGKPAARQAWAVRQMELAATASRNFGFDTSVSFSGALAWPFIYPWPQRPAGLIEEAFDELARRWRPILDAYDEAGVDVGYEIHPGEDLFDGATFEMFLERVGSHPRCRINYDPSHFVLQQLDYLDFIEIYADRICAFHVKDAEFNPTGRQGVYSGYQPWKNRAGRFRSLGDGQVDFSAVFSALATIGYEGWAVVEWECALKEAEAGAREGAAFVREHIIPVTDKAFDDFAGGGSDRAAVRRLLGLGD